MSAPPRRARSNYAGIYTVALYDIEFFYRLHIFYRSPSTVWPPGTSPFSPASQRTPLALLARVKRPCIENECSGGERGSVTLRSIMTPKTPPRCVYLSVRTQPARRRIKFGRTSDLTATRGSYNAGHIVFHAGNFAIDGSDLGVAGSPAF